jgi:hypothetical protein
MAEQMRLFGDNTRRDPIIDSLTNVNIEYWRSEGLFRRAEKIVGAPGDLRKINISVGDKMRFVQAIIGRWFTIQRGEIVRGASAGRKWPKQLILAERHYDIKDMFDYETDAAAKITLDFITQDYPVGAAYYAKHKLHIRWRPFKDAVNDTLVRVMIKTGVAK